MAAALPEIGLLALVARPVILAVGGGSLSASPNAAACRLLGVVYAENRQVPLVDLIGGEASSALATFAAGLPRNGVGARLSQRCVTPKGDALLTTEVARVPGRSDAYVLTLADSSGDASAAQALAQAHAVIEALPVGIELYDADFNAVFYNRKSDELFDYGERAVVNYQQWWDLAFPEPERRAIARAEWKALVEAAKRDRTRAVMAEWEVVCADGERRMMQFYYQVAGDGFSSIMWDVTEQRRLEGELRSLAETDSLTGLLNRRSFFATAESWLSRAAADAPMALLMLDIDHFKRVNDRFGHGVGDEVLATVARRARSALRKEDAIARIGGEEFAAFLPGAREAEARAVATRIREAIVDEPVMAGDAALPITVSIGVAARKAGEADADAIVARADRALYAAKAAGRDRIEEAEGSLA